jgi:hypothetical protein
METGFTGLRERIVHGARELFSAGFPIADGEVFLLLSFERASRRVLAPAPAPSFLESRRATFDFFKGAFDFLIAMLLTIFSDFSHVHAG